MKLIPHPDYSIIQPLPEPEKKQGSLILHNEILPYIRATIISNHTPESPFDSGDIVRINRYDAQTLVDKENNYFIVKNSSILCMETQ